MLSLDDAGQLLRRSAFFRSTSASAIRALSDHSQLVRLSAGELLFKKGDPGSAMYFIVDGCVQVHHAEMVVILLERGEVFGEVAALSSETRTASVSARTDTVLLKLERDAIYATLASHPDAVRSMIEALCHRESEVIGEKLGRMIQARVLEHELEIGQKIQRNFLPAAIPAMEGWQLDGMLQPARKVAGDFYDFFMVPKLQCMGIVIGDVCDKGVGAALFMTLFRSLIRCGALYGGSMEPSAGNDEMASTLRHALNSTNRYIASTHRGSSMFASVFFGLIVPRTGLLRYVNAGHESPWIGHGDRVRTQLPTTGPVVGLFEDAEFEVGSAELRPGEWLFAYTDGATDAQNEAGEAFTEDLLRRTFVQGAADDAPVLEMVRQALEGFIGKADQFDDITMISARRGLH
jgi:phosphoserine phosphatase RsbU/P